MTNNAVFAISPHGFGHIAQVAPIVEALHRRSPDTRISIFSTADNALLRRFIACPFEHVPCEQDPDVAMRGPLEVDVPATVERYRRWHAEYETHERRLRQLLQRSDAGIVVSDIGYTVLEAAARADIPSLAISSLNWADIVWPYCREFDGMADICARMLDAYNAADRFLLLEPAMPMPHIRHTAAVGPVARVGTDRKSELLQRLRLPRDTRLALFSLGGIPADTAVRNWSVPERTHWIVPDDCEVDDPRFSPLQRADMPYIDVLASADVLVTKPGYGSFTEAACNGVPVIFVRRGDWPEEPALVDWLQRQGNAAELTRREFAAGDYIAAFDTLATLPAKPAITPTGVEQVANIILETVRF